MNYLQYINSVYRHVTNNSSIRYLISGVDFRVRQVFGKYITDSSYNDGKIIFILDNTQNGSYFTNFCSFIN